MGRSTSLPWTYETLRQRRAERSSGSPLVLAAALLAGGIVLDRFLPFTFGGWLFLGGILLVSWWRQWARRNDSHAAALLCGAVVMLGAALHHAEWSLFATNEIGRYARLVSEPVCLEAVVAAAPQVWRAPAPSPLRAIPSGAATSLVLTVERLRNGAEWRPVSGRCELRAEGVLPPLSAGDRVQIFAQLQQPMPALNPGEFDWALDRRGDRELARLRCDTPESMTILSLGSPWRWRRWGDALRGAVDRTLLRVVGPEQGPLAMAMVTGSQQLLSEEVRELFRRTGAMHVLVVSGTQVSMVVGLLYLVLRMGWAPRAIATLGIMLLAALYTDLAGGAPPVQRAMIVAQLVCLASLMSRRGVAMNSLGAAGLVILALHPADLFRSGAQLSFLATAVLVWFGQRKLQDAPQPPLEKLIAECRPGWQRGGRALGRGVWLVTLASVAVSLVTAPLLAHRYHLLSPIAAPLSPVVLPLVAVIVVAGLAAVALAWVPGVGPLLGKVCQLGSAGLVEVVKASDPLPGASFSTPGPATWWVLGAYALGAMCFVSPPVRRRGLALALMWLIAGVAPAVMRLLPRDELRCTFISVGHGLSTLIEAPNGAKLLYDAGALSGPEQAAERISAVLWSRGVTRLDGVIISHADIDHYNALPILLEHFRIAHIYVAPQMAPRLFDNGVSGPTVLRQALDKHGVKSSQLSLGDRMNLGGATLEVIHPDRRGIYAADNAGSLVLAAEYAGRRILLTGDLQSPGLDDLLAQEPLPCDVLLAPHHGSALSNPPGLTRWCQPEAVVLSCGQQDDVAEVTRSHRLQGREILATDHSGAVTVRIFPNKLEFFPYWKN